MAGKNRIRVGIVGCGEVTQIMHLPTLYQLSELFEVTALCDVSEKVLNQVGDTWGVTNRTQDYLTLVNRDDVDAVLIANPHAYHAEVTTAAIQQGKHVLVEKPMCMTLREADEIIAAQQQTGMIVQVGYMRRYAPAFLQACDIVKKLPEIKLAKVHDVIGENALIIRTTSRVIRDKHLPLSMKTQAKKLADDLVTEAIGDAPKDLREAYLVLLGLSSHDISAMREILGMPKGVLYAAKRHEGRYLTAAFDYGSFVCQFETGIDKIARFDGFIEVYGVDKVVRVQYDTPYVRNLPIKLFVTEAGKKGSVNHQSIHPAWGDPFVVEWQAFAHSIETKEAPKTQPSDFRKDLEIFSEMIELMRETSKRGYNVLQPSREQPSASVAD